MSEKYFYVNPTRIIMVCLSFVAFVGMGMRLWNVNCPSWVFYVCYGCAMGITIFLFGKYLGAPPFDLLESNSENHLNLNGAFGSECYDEDGNPLGTCTGAYLTPKYISLMVDGKMYDIKDVYFEDDEEEEEYDERY